MTLKKFFELFMEYYTGSKYGSGKSSAIKWIGNNLSKYSDGGPNKEDWFENNQSKEMNFTVYTEGIGENVFYVVEINDSDYDAMKIKFSRNDGLVVGRHIYLAIRDKGNKV